MVCPGKSFDDPAEFRDVDMDSWEQIRIDKLVQSNGTACEAQVKFFSRRDKSAAGRINAADASSSSPKGCVLYRKMDSRRKF